MWRSAVFVVMLVSCVHVAAQDRLVQAICKKSEEELKAVFANAAAKGAAIDIPEGADKDSMAAILYKQAQGEIPGGGEPKPWPGCDGVDISSPTTPAADSKPPKPAVRSKQAVDGGMNGMTAEKMAKLLFRANDKDKDGKLSRTELQTMVEQTNAAAKAKGEPEVDFFKAVDRDQDGSVTPSEAEAYFATQMPGSAGKAGGGSAAKPSAKKAAPDMQAAMFKNLDKDGDGLLSREEMKAIIEKTNQNAANQQQGESGEDFFNTLDRDSSGSIDKDEVAAFLAATASQLGKDAPASLKSEL